MGGVITYIHSLLIDHWIHEETVLDVSDELAFGH